MDDASGAARGDAAATVRRILGRYLEEIVERHEFCPWARGARLQGELAVGIVWGEPDLDAWQHEAERLLATPGAAVAMVVAPESSLARHALARLRDQLAAALPAAGVAEFHPDAPLDLATPARLVPFLRRSPDPMLQLVPLRLLDAARATPPPPDRAQQAAMLRGHAPPPRPAIAERIAAANHATAARAHAELAARLDAIAADRAASYAAAGITATVSWSRSRS